ncbi:MAG TPA: hypothetical protein VMT85_25620 [Thermoanaerobaculia bacterium]|nr:hypothetical protein [Thermoanaerobaculia bacterium]
MDEPGGARPPIIIDLGKQKRKRIKALKEGRGPLMAEVAETMGELVRQLGEEAGNEELVPVIVLYERKPRKRTGTLPFFPFK